MERAAGCRTPRDFVEVARRILAAEGIGAVDVARVCRELHVSRGSFYHHFPQGLGQLRRLMMLAWQRESQEFLDGIAAVPDPLGRLEAVANRLLEMDHVGERGVRAWARSSGVVAECVRRVDHTREAMYRTCLIDFGDSARRAADIAGVGVLMLAGLQAAQPFDLREFVDAGLVWMNEVVGIRADATEHPQHTYAVRLHGRAA